jgi:hypothetical protein
MHKYFFETSEMFNISQKNVQCNGYGLLLAQFTAPCIRTIAVQGMPVCCKSANDLSLQYGMIASEATTNIFLLSSFPRLPVFFNPASQEEVTQSAYI